jgi:hypothetical protein
MLYYRTLISIWTKHSCFKVNFITEVQKLAYACLTSFYCWHFPVFLVTICINLVSHTHTHTHTHNSCPVASRTLQWEVFRHIAGTETEFPNLHDTPRHTAGCVSVRAAALPACPVVRVMEFNGRTVSDAAIFFPICTPHGTETPSTGSSAAYKNYRASSFKC